LNKNEKRKNIRYEISEYIKEEFLNDISLEINTDRIYIPRVMDISLNGLGYTLEENDSINLEDFDKFENYFININLVNKVILVEVKKIWSVIIQKEGKRILTGGVAFSVISPDDRLIIAKYINTIRN
jgi:hypothetical protein